MIRKIIDNHELYLAAIFFAAYAEAQSLALAFPSIFFSMASFCFLMLALLEICGNPKP